MSNQEPNPAGMGPKAALRLEIFIIGIGLLALILIFQPFSLALFGIGAALVVFAGLINNLLPLAQPNVRLRSVLMIGLMVLMIFGIVLLIAIGAAHLYGVYFLTAPATASPVANIPFYNQPFVWWLAGITAWLGALVSVMSTAGRR